MARKDIATLLFGAALVTVWGVELIKDVFGWLNVPHHSITVPGIEFDYDEYLRFWLTFRGVVAAVGVAAGILVIKRLRLGYWLSLLSAAALLAFATDFGWFSSVAAGKFTTNPLRFFVVVPDLAYNVIIFPLLVASSIIVSAVTLLKHRWSNAAVAQRAI